MRRGGLVSLLELSRYLWNVGGSSAVTHEDGLPPSIALGEVVLLTSYYGKMPCLNCGTAKGNHGHQWCNGGIPQLANLTAHVAAMERDMDAKVPSNFTGWIVHDCEAWVIPWALSGNGHADSGSRYAAYENASVALARSLNPTASEAELNKIAAAAYTKAGIDLLVLTVHTTKRLRPHIAGVGFLPRIITCNIDMDTQILHTNAVLVRNGAGTTVCHTSSTGHPPS